MLPKMGRTPWREFLHFSFWVVCFMSPNSYVQPLHTHLGELQTCDIQRRQHSNHRSAEPSNQNQVFFTMRLFYKGTAKSEQTTERKRCLFLLQEPQPSTPKTQVRNSSVLGKRPTVSQGKVLHQKQGLMNGMISISHIFPGFIEKEYVCLSFSEQTGKCFNRQLKNGLQRILFITFSNLPSLNDTHKMYNIKKLNWWLRTVGDAMG